LQHKIRCWKCFYPHTHTQYL